jgi:multidrug transporter EmrE-like cation transporter
MRYGLLAGTIVLMAAGQVLFKTAATEPGRWSFILTPAFIAALFLYAATTLLWVFTLRYWPITAAYPATAIAIALVTIAGVMLFGEKPSPQHWLGIAVILSGLLILVGA